MSHNARPEPGLFTHFPAVQLAPPSVAAASASAGRGSGFAALGHHSLLFRRVHYEVNFVDKVDDTERPSVDIVAAIPLVHLAQRRIR